MTFTRTATGVCNMALDLLTEAPMTDYTTDGTPEALWFVRNYADTRDAELEEHPWRFALKRATITVDATAPTDTEWLYRYAIPSDCLRLLPVRYLGEFEAPPIPHEVFQAEGFILTDEPNELVVQYIYQITDTTKFTALFTEALAAKLAMKGAHWLTHKAGMVEEARAAYKDALIRAKRANAFVGTPERPYDDDVIAARYAT